MSNRYGSRLRIMRPVGWPITSTHGQAIARSSRSVICASSWLNAEWTEAMTMSSCARQSSARSIAPSGADVALDARQHGDAVEARVELADRPRVLERAGLVEAVGHREGAAVIGDGDVLEPGRPRRQRHRLGVGAAVGRRGVHVQVAAEILPLDQPGERPLLGGRNFAPVLPQLGRHEREAERLVDAFLRLAGDLDVVVHAEQAVLVQLEPALDRAIAEGDVVRLRAGEVLLRGAEALPGHEPQIGLEPSRTAARSISSRLVPGRARRGGSW